MSLDSSGRLNLLSLVGKIYTPTSTSGTTAITDTQIFYNTAVIGYGEGAIYDVAIIGNPLTGGSGAYRNTILGTILVGAGWNGSQVVQRISYTTLASMNPGADGFGMGTFTISVVFWDGTTETTFVPHGAGTTQIRIKIGGYQSSYVGSYQQINLTKRL
jgi:hypothetical protein